MFIVVSYDIPEDRRRAKVLKTLKNFGLHVQYSVFECHLNAAEYKRLRQTLKPLLDQRRDNMRFYVLCEEDVKKKTVWGQERVDPEIKGWYLIASKEQVTGNKRQP